MQNLSNGQNQNNALPPCPICGSKEISFIQAEKNEDGSIEKFYICESTSVAEFHRFSLDETGVVTTYDDSIDELLSSNKGKFRFNIFGAYQVLAFLSFVVVTVQIIVFIIHLIKK